MPGSALDHLLRKGRIGGRYAHLVELGTKAGTRITRKKEFRIFGEGKEVETNRIDHLGQGPSLSSTAFDNKYEKANKEDQRSS